MSCIPQKIRTFHYIRHLFKHKRKRVQDPFNKILFSLRSGLPEQFNPLGEDLEDQKTVEGCK